MAKKTIYVGYEYKKAFDSICRLIRGRCLEGMDYEVHGNVISAGVYNYELSDTAGRKAGEEEFGFTKRGASWFRALRGEHMENDNAIWMSFMDNVKNAYHRNFSVVEYEQQPKTEKELKKAIHDAQHMGENFTRLFFPTLHQAFEVQRVTGKEFTEDIYGVSMRIELSAAVTRGAPLPVLCKVYFNKSGKLIRPLAREAAAAIDDNISHIVPDDDTAQDGVVSSDVIFNALDAINKLITDPKRHYPDYTNFADYICFSDETDRIAVETLGRQMSHDNFELECRRVDLLYITHIKADAFMFDICAVGVPMFRAAIGLNNTVSIRCLNCGEEAYLVDRNEISYEVDGKKKSVMLDIDEPDFGLDSETIEEILQYSSIKDHFVRMACPGNRRNPACSAHKCRSQLFEVEENGEKVFKCLDCAYPEMVYPDFDGNRRYTPTMLFAKDRMELLAEGEEVKMDKCKSCGRYFTSHALKGGRCPICAGSDSLKDSAQAKRKYREYRTMLSLGTRVKSAFSRKRCIEDDEMIIFVLGEKKYAFNKLNVKEYGALEKPYRMI